MPYRRFAAPRAAATLALLLTSLLNPPAWAQASAPAAGYDAAQAQAWGANDNGMRAYTFVLLKTGPKRMPHGPERDAMFQGHFANIERLAKEGLLVYAGPLDGVDGWRGLFIFATADLAVARQAVETDPVVIQGEMVPELHKHFGSAALMGVTDQHRRLVKPKP